VIPWGEYFVKRGIVMPEKVRGVALLLVSISGRIWTIEELQDKPRYGKRAGDWSVPMETNEPGETDPETLLRLLQEEAPAGTEIYSGFGFEFLTGVDICGNALVKTYVALFVRADEENIPLPFRSEVRAVGWKTVDEILARRCRAGVREMLDAYRAVGLGGPVSLLDEDMTSVRSE
jgi:ADP-ribose pyrophosphatase YjhB (NUDIX family)